MVPKSNRKSLLEVRRSAGKRSVKVRGDSPYPVTVHHSSTTTEDVLVEGRVDSIQGMRICEGVFQYWVHWANYDEKDNSWEPVENLTNCHDQLVAWYKATQEYKRVHTQQTASKSAVSGLDLIEAARSAGRRVDGQPRESASSSISLLAGGKPSGRLSNGRYGRFATKMVVAPALKHVAVTEEELPGALASLPMPEALVVQDGIRRNPMRTRASRNTSLKPGKIGESSPSGSGQGGQRSVASNLREKTLGILDGITGRKKNLRSASMGPQKNAPARKKVKVATARAVEAEDEDGDDRTTGQEAHPELYVVERILGSLTDRNGHPWFLVKWMDFPLEDSSWEDAPAVKQASAEVNKFRNKYGKPTVNKPKILSAEGKTFEAWVSAGSKGTTGKA